MNPAAALPPVDGVVGGLGDDVHHAPVPVVGMFQHPDGDFVVGTSGALMLQKAAPSGRSRLLGVSLLHRM